jgi:hypothetical protein
MKHVFRILLVSFCLVPTLASAQTRPKFVPTGDLGGDIKRATAPAIDPNATTAPSGVSLGDSGCKATGEPIADLHCVIKSGGAKLILHLKQSYALTSAPGASGTPVDNTSAMCTKALVPIFELVINGPKPGTVPDGDPMALTADEKTAAAAPNSPDGPIVVITKIRILRLALESPALNDACGALVQDEVKNAQSLIGKVTSLVTGAGIAGLPAAIGL